MTETPQTQGRFRELRLAVESGGPSLALLLNERVHPGERVVHLERISSPSEISTTVYYVLLQDARFP